MTNTATRSRITVTDTTGFKRTPMLVERHEWAVGYVNDLSMQPYVKHIDLEQVPVVIVDLPQRFFDDHTDRELYAGCVEQRLSKKIRVSLDREAYDELLSDARYYTDPSTVAQLGPQYVGLVSSARATIRALEAVEPPAEPKPEPTWSNEIGKHTLVLGEGESIVNPTRTGHRLNGPKAFVYRVWEDGGLDITEVDLDDARLSS